MDNWAAIMLQRHPQNPEITQLLQAMRDIAAEGRATQAECRRILAENPLSVSARQSLQSIAGFNAQTQYLLSHGPNDPLSQQILRAGAYQVRNMASQNIVDSMYASIHASQELQDKIQQVHETMMSVSDCQG
jgi:hypothetical protein